MSHNREQFETATEKWLQLGGSHCFEHVSPHRQVAILHAATGDTEHFRDEAIRLQNFYHTVGRDALILDSLDTVTLQIALQEKAISDLIIIGDGDFSSIQDDETGQKLDWQDISRLTTDLKNSVTQRLHSPVPPTENPGVPLLLFASGTHKRVYAPPTYTFQPGAEDNHSGYVTRVSPAWRMDYTAVERLRPTNDS